jgi:membrane-associated phospholipid phosphatase
MLPTHFWALMTDFGDSAVLAPAALVIAVWLVAERAWRGALLWCLLFGFGVMLVVASKIAFMGWGIGSQAINFTGVSGHALMATSVYGTGLWLVLQRQRRAFRVTGVVVGLVAGALIGLSRLVLDAHSPAEVLAGFLLGAVVSLGFVRLSRCCSALPNRPPLALVAVSAMLTVGTYGDHAPTQPFLTKVALRLSGHPQPYTRETWRRTAESQLSGETQREPFERAVSVT